MWVRSQNKKQLLPIGLGGFYPFNVGTSIRLSSTSNHEVWWVVGVYKTEERTIKVLDEIQNFIIGKEIVNHYDNSCISNQDNEAIAKFAVYQMPKE